MSELSLAERYLALRGPRPELPESPLRGIPQLLLPKAASPVPDEAACLALWDKYGMLDNIRAHSLLVADSATALARMAVERGFPVDVSAVRASGLLHDIAKTYCLLHGGSHAHLGAAWVVAETGNYAVAQGVFHHFCWPWPMPLDQPDRLCSLPFFIMYADKRARHDEFVTLDERFSDLLDRYGTTPQRRDGIFASYVQARDMEQALSGYLGRDLAGLPALR